MIRLIDAEFRKLRTTWAWWLLLALAIAYVVIGAVAQTLASEFTKNQQLPSLNTVAGLRGVYSAARSASIFILILGVLGITTEYRHMTITSTFLVSPRRTRVVAAKIATYAVAGLGYGLAATAAAFGSAAVTLSALGRHLTAPGLDLPLLAGGAILGNALYAVVGLGIGALVRNQIAAIVGSLIWFQLVEALLVALLPVVGKWLPGGAASAMLDVTVRNGHLLPAWAGALLFIGYGLAFAVLGAAFTIRRDVT